ncbi:hypothetical protein WN51_09569 [Melipona quadrifasciata]|uniref:Uncharacterized protein n=1 Tax=Melipona quadrifasciata TaxID=166423 RepID=A0A0M9A6G1_9HYME|nr:hypothetical protein WN51_09569 [Melipona quadrifasciata]
MSTPKTDGLGFLNYEFRTLTRHKPQVAARLASRSCRSPTLSKAEFGTPLGWVFGRPAYRWIEFSEPRNFTICGLKHLGYQKSYENRLLDILRQPKIEAWGYESYRKLCLDRYDGIDNWFSVDVGFVESAASETKNCQTPDSHTAILAKFRTTRNALIRGSYKRSNAFSSQCTIRSSTNYRVSTSTKHFIRAEDFIKVSSTDFTSWPRALCVLEVRPLRSAGGGTPRRAATEASSFSPMTPTSIPCRSVKPTLPRINTAANTRTTSKKELSELVAVFADPRDLRTVKAAAKCLKASVSGPPPATSNNCLSNNMEAYVFPEPLVPKEQLLTNNHKIKTKRMSNCKSTET